MVVVLVTGGGGFIGSATARALLTRGDFVVLLDEMNDYYDVTKKEANVQALLAAFGSRVVFVKGDFCDKTLVEQVFLDWKPDIVCHLGARAGVRPSIDDPLLYVQANVQGTTELLEAAVRHKCTNFVYASSSSVYGGSENDAFRETDNIMQPYSQYAATKASCELIASTYNHLYKINTCGLRFFTVYGPNGRPDMAPYKFIDRIFRGLPIDQYGDGSSERDYTFIDDIVDGVVRACDTPQGNVVFNLGNGRPTLLKDFIATIESLLGKKAIINHLPNQPGDVPRTCADITEAREKLGYNPQTPLSVGLRKTVAWYLQNVAGSESGATHRSSSETTPTTSSTPNPPTLNPTANANANPMGAVQNNRQDVLATAFRIHRRQATATMDLDLDALKRAVTDARQYSSLVSVAVDAEDSVLLSAVQQMLASIPQASATVHTVLVEGWGRFVPALNALIHDACAHGCTAILFQSTEIEATPLMVRELQQHLADGQTLVAGACLPGHAFAPTTVGEVPGDGASCPWNTFAMWDLARLARTGFALVSDGGCPGVRDEDAGVEEVAAIALQQLISGGSHNARAKLVEVSGIAWHTDFEDPKRAQWHRKKMDSKRERAAVQLRALGAPPPTVLHIASQAN